MLSFERRKEYISAVHLAALTLGPVGVEINTERMLFDALTEQEAETRKNTLVEVEKFFESPTEFCKTCEYHSLDCYLFMLTKDCPAWQAMKGE